MAERHPLPLSGPSGSGSRPGPAPAATPPSRSGWGPVAGVVLAALALAGCGGIARQSYSEMPEYAALASVVATDKALILPGPGGPAVMNIVQKLTENTITQTIFLANDSRSPGENQMTVTLWGPVGRDGWGVEFNPKRPTANSVYKEMVAALPGVPMHFSSYYVQNKYGPFGYAIGVPASGGLCIYGWQLIRAKPQDFFAPNLKRGAISTRVRVCQANVTEAQLLQIMYDYTITGYFPPGIWNPYGDLPPVDPTIGTLNNPRMPVGREGLASPVGGEVPMTGERQGAVGRTGSISSAPRSRVRRTATVAPTAPLVVQPLPTATRPDTGFPVVPPPPGSSITPAPAAPQVYVPPAQAWPSATSAPAAVPMAPRPVQTAVPVAPRVVAPQMTPSYSTVPATTAAPSYPSTAPAYTSPYATTPQAYPSYPSTTPSLGTRATVPVPSTGATITPATVSPPAGLQNPYNQ